MKKIISFIIVIVVIGSAFYFYKKIPHKESTNAITDSENMADGIDEQIDTIEQVLAPDIKKVDSSTNTYLHKKYNFTFNYPSEFKTSNFNEGGGEQILFSASKGDWFQIYVTPWDEEGDISAARIKKDLPDIVISNPQNVILGPRQKDGVGPHALIFFSKDSSLGETREVWFVMNGNLYQITTYKRLDLVIGQVLSTLVFN